MVVHNWQPSLGQPRLAEPMEIAALGRSFSLGALYDVRTEHLSPLKLWKQATLEEHKYEEPQPFTDFKYQAVNSFDQKTDFMDIEGSVKMSFISGLVEVEGSAKFLTEKKSLKNSASVSMVMKRRSKVESLTQELFSNVEFEDYLTHQGFTHVVTKIVYGADAYFQFSQSLSDEKSQKDIEGDLAAKIAGIFSVKASVDITESEKKKYEAISVDFNGDFDNIVPPKTFLEAAAVATKISKEPAVVPMQVTLTPLHVLNDQVTVLLRDINHDTIRRAGELRSIFGQVEEQLDSERAGEAVRYFPKLKENLDFVERMFDKKKGAFTSSLRTLLPLIRNNTVPEQTLIDLLNEAENGIFHKTYFDSWLNARKKYAHTLGRRLTVLAADPDVKFLSEKHLLLDFELDHQTSYYILEGSLKGLDESFYIKALKENNTDIIENAPVDRESWVDKYKRRVTGILARFDRLSKLRDYQTDAFNDLSNVRRRRPLQRGSALSRRSGGQRQSQRNNILTAPPPSTVGIPKRAIFIDMPGGENNLKIKTFYGGVEIKLKALENIGFEDDNEHFLYKKQTAQDIETVEADIDYYPNYPDYYPDSRIDIKVLGYEIRYRRANKKNYDYIVNILKKTTLTPGQKYLINVRIILEGGVRGPWNRRDYEYVRPLQAVAGQWSAWSVVSSCNKACGLGKQRERRLCDSPAPTNGGKQCVKEDGKLALVEEKSVDCQVRECPVDCTVSEWAPWTTCSRECGTGERKTKRKIIKEPQHGGASCPSLIWKQDCSKQTCPTASPTIQPKPTPTPRQYLNHGDIDFFERQ